MGKKPPCPYFDSRIFGDAAHTELNYELRANFIIACVFERGDVEYIRWYRRYYGDMKIIDTPTKAKFLPLHTTYFVSSLFNKPLEEFRCYILRQLNPALYPY